MTLRSFAPTTSLRSPDIEGSHDLNRPTLALDPPVFLHSSFRTSSTWLWGKLREAPTTFAYYEIFNETLRNLTPEKIGSVSYDGWTSKHPPSAPYFLEFAPLLTKGQVGVPGYTPQMAVENFIPKDGIDGCLNGEEERHIAGLIGYAQRQGRVPVLSDVRTLGRAPAIKRSIGGTHVLIVRNIFHQWASFSKQLHDGNDYFFRQIQAIIRSSPHDPFMAMLDAALQHRMPETTNRGFLQTFIILHLYLYAKNFDVSDVIVDINAICTDPSARALVEEQLSRAIRHPLDLSNVRDCFEVSFTDIGPRQPFVDLIDQFTKIISGCFDKLSPQRDAFVENIKNNALAEIDRNEFYCKGLRTLYVALSKRAGETSLVDKTVVCESAHGGDGRGSSHGKTNSSASESDASRREAAEPLTHKAAVRRATRGDRIS